MEEPNLQPPDLSHPLFQSSEHVSKFMLDKLQNENGAMKMSEVAAAIYNLALNLDRYMTECVELRIKLENVMAGAELGQQMMDNIEKRRDQHLVRKKNEEIRKTQS